MALEHGFASWPRFKRHIEDLATGISFEKGEDVRVIEGPFSNFLGRVREVRPEKEQVLVMVEVFGRSTPVWLSYEHVEKA